MKSFLKYTITPCRQDGKLTPIIFNNHRLCDNKYESLKESEDTDSKVTSDDNKSGVEENICTSNENTEIISSVPNMDGIDHNGIGVNYENDDSDEMDNGWNDNDSSVNKSLLNEYHLSQYIALATSNVSSTQFSKASLLNVRTNLDFESISILIEKRKRISNDNCLKKNTWKVTLFLK